MKIIIVLFCLMLGHFAKIRNRYIFNPATIFCYLFGAILSLNCFEIGRLYPAKETTFLLIGMGVFSFFLGCVFVNQKTITHTIPRNLNKKKFRACAFVTILILLPDIIRVGTFLIMGGSIGELYILAANAVHGDSNELSASSLSSILTTSIGYPLLYVVVPISVVVFFQTHQRKYILLAVIFTFIRICTDARRTYVVSFILILIFTFLLHSSQTLSVKLQKEFKKQKYLVFSIVALCLFAFTFFSDERAKEQGHKSSFSTTFVNYYGGCVYYFEKALEHSKDTYTYGFSSIRGFAVPFCGVLKKVGINIPVYEDASKSVLALQEQIVYITPEKAYNSFATCFYQFYVDFGFVGIFFLSFLYGFVSQRIYLQWLVNQDMLHEIILIFWTSTILMFSFVNMELTNSCNALPLILVYWIFDKNKYEIQRVC